MSSIGPAGALDAALAASLRGAQGAAQRFERAAGRIAQAGTETPRAPEPIAARDGGPNLLAAQRQETDLPTEMIQARLAQRAYEANLAVMRRAGEMRRDAIDMLG